jgi:hypothetical protein
LRSRHAHIFVHPVPGGLQKNEKMAGSNPALIFL